jgi:lipopolysaccharide transport system ATP-binding protein
MSDIALRVENLAKQYQIRVTKDRHDTLRDQLADGLKALFRRNGQAALGKDTIWALKDVSFEVQEGEVIGIIGRNGAGKSTLLKILSRITGPTEGRVEVYGRVGSLLEVGTGFHPELTGRENIYLNGAILGMKKEEVKRKFDDIVAFAEVEKFIDTPVKRYSSGMYVRLAFAVAAHLEPEILIVDEVLAVGDAAFQKKCLGKLGSAAKEGRTVLFVSHNMPAVQNLTARSLLLDRGHVVLDAPTAEVVDRYMNPTEPIEIQPVVHLRHHPGRLPGMTPALGRIWMTDAGGNLVTFAAMGSDVTIYVEYEVDGIVRQPIVGLVFETLHGDRVFSINNKMAPGAEVIDAAPKGVLSCHIPCLPLIAGDYFITVAFARSVEADIDRIEKAYRLAVVPADVYGTGYIPARENGTCILYGQWKFMPD